MRKRLAVESDAARKHVAELEARADAAAAERDALLAKARTLDTCCVCAVCLPHLLKSTMHACSSLMTCSFWQRHPVCHVGSSHTKLESRNVINVRKLI